MPVSVTVNVPAAVEVQDSIEVCGDGGRVTLDGVSEQTGPDGETAEVSATVPVSPFSPVTVIVEVAAVLPSAGAAPGADAAIVKSTMWNVTGPVE